MWDDSFGGPNPVLQSHEPNVQLAKIQVLTML